MAIVNGRTELPIENNTGNEIHRNSSILNRSIQDYIWFKKRRIRNEHTVRTLVAEHIRISDYAECDEHLRKIKRLHHHYCKNKIKTTKYTILSFLPKNLFEQFHRLANCFFVFTVMLNFVPLFSAIQPYLSMVPVIGILIVQGIKDLFEDYGRLKNDKEVNNAYTQQYQSSDNKYHKVKWALIEVGDIVRVECNNIIPADLLLLHSSDKDGVCYLETSNIDGESNLKQRMIVKKHWGDEHSHEFHPFEFKSIIECQTPNNQIYKFHGNIIPPDGRERISVNNNNLLLRGCVIRNTDYVEGIVIYAGHETKAMLNNNGPRYKRSKLERRMNGDVVYCVILLVIMCLTGAIGNGIWANYMNQIPQTSLFKPLEPDGNVLDPGLSGFYMFWTMVILLQILIPISLYVSLELVKVGQVFMINNDIDLYHKETDTPMLCRALNITEDLGQIQYVFSDKTGTLTENKMIFRRCTIGGVDYPHAKNAERIENAEPANSSVSMRNLNRSGSSVLRQSQRRPHSASVRRPHHRRTKSNISRNVLDNNQFNSTRSAPNSPLSTRKNNASTRRPAPYHRRNISSVSAIEVFKTAAHESDESEVNSINDDEVDILATDVIPDPVLLKDINQIHDHDYCGTSTVVNQRILDFFINLAICNTVVLSNGSRNLGLEKKPAKNLSETYRSVSPFDNEATKSEDVNVAATDETKNEINNRYTMQNLLDIEYEAESPDEAALVYAARAYNFTLSHRSSQSGDETVAVTLPNGHGVLTFKVLHKFPFDSTRKRMSVMVHDPRINEIVLFCKGADSAIFSQLCDESEPQPQFNIDDGHLDANKFPNNSPRVVSLTKHFLLAYAHCGLRTLLISKKVVLKDEYDKWLVYHTLAERSLENRDQLLMESCLRMESNLQLLGATGIEDKLQEGVPETIESLRQAGIQVWVLTGDKQETAINIGYASRLIHQNDEKIVLNAESKEALKVLLETHIKEQNNIRGDQQSLQTQTSILSSFNISFSLPYSTNYPGIDNTTEHPALVLIVDGKTLGFALQKDLQKNFVQLARRCRSVLCCRATPLQKGEIVKLMREELNVMTLAIGDGANDVSMIQVADVGIGLSGQEGMQAVMSSDYALAQFRFLRKLLLVHGHWNYARLATMVLYFFYKNAAFVFLIFWFQIYCGFSGANMIEQFPLITFNLIFTSVPPLINAVLDQDVSQKSLLFKPKLYEQGLKDELYMQRTFWINIIDACYQSLAIFFIVLAAYHDSDVGLIEWGTGVTTAALFVILLHLAIETKSWTWIHWVAQLGSVLVYFATILIYNIICPECLPPSNPYFVMERVIQTGQFWFSVLLATVVALFPRYFIRAVQAHYFPTESIMERNLENSRKHGKSSSTSSSSVTNSAGSSSNHPNPAFINQNFKNEGGSLQQRRPSNLFMANGRKQLSEVGKEALDYSYGGSTPDMSSMSPYYGNHNVNNSNNVELPGVENSGYMGLSDDDETQAYDIPTHSNPTITKGDVPSTSSDYSNYNDDGYYPASDIIYVNNGPSKDVMLQEKKMYLPA